jgi:guanine deaminase
VGAGTGLFLPKEALQAYFVQRLLGPDGMNLTPVHLLYLATRAGARALGLDDRTGDFSVGKHFDAVWLRPAAGGTLAVNLRHARDTTDALARIFSLATPADVAGVWTRGVPGRVPSPGPSSPASEPRAAPRPPHLEPASSERVQRCRCDLRYGFRSATTANFISVMTIFSSSYHL